jgi:membrane protease YdiL (CAAX protease family)
MASAGSYFRATRHPWVCVLFVLPLLLVYECGVLLCGPGQPETLRNGADVWLQTCLANVGLREGFWAPVLLTVLLLAWCWLRRADRPREYLGAWVGTVLESGLFAMLLWGLCHGILPLLESLGVQFSLSTTTEPALTQLISYLGAGIYEETLFRLLLFSFLGWGLMQLELPRSLACLFAALLSALVFALAHNVGPHGEPFDPYFFIFRTLAGLYFAFLYLLRGLGVAVGAHAGYDVLVGILLEL